MEKQTGISKELVRRHIQNGVDRISGLFETISKGHSGTHAELQKSLRDFQHRLLAVVDGIEGDRMVYEEDIQDLCLEVQIGVKHIRNGWKRTNLSHAQKPFSAMVNGYMNEICATVRQSYQFGNKPVETETADRNDQQLVRADDDLFGYFGEFPQDKLQDHLNDVENYFMELTTTFETHWARDVVLSLKKANFINQSGEDAEILSKETLDIVTRFFELVHSEESNLRLFARHSFEVQGGCGFSAFKAYWAKLLLGINKAKILSQSVSNVETVRLTELLHRSLVEKFVPAIQALELDVFVQFHRGLPVDIMDPRHLIMPGKNSYLHDVQSEGNAREPLPFSPAEHALKKRYQKNGFSNEDTASVVNDVFHGGLPVRDASSFELRPGRNSLAVLSVRSRSREGLAEVHGDIMNSFSRELSTRLNSRLLEIFYEESSHETREYGDKSIFINKEEFEGLCRISTMLNQTVIRYFKRFHGMLGNARRIERFFIDQIADFEEGLDAELREVFQNDDEFISYFGSVECLKVHDLGLDYRILVGQIHEGKSLDVSSEQMSEDQLVAALLLGERVRHDYDGSFFPEEIMLLQRYLADAVSAKGQDIDNIVQQLSEEGRFDQWSRNINNSLHGGCAVRTGKNIPAAALQILEDRKSAMAAENESRKRKETESRLQCLGKEILGILQWIEEIRFDELKRKGVLYDMVELYVNILRTVDLREGRVACPIDVLEFQVLPFLQKIRTNYEDLQVRRRGHSSEDGQYCSKPLFSLSVEDLADLMQNGPNKKVETHPSAPVVDRVAFALRTIDQRIASCASGINAAAVQLELLERQHHTLTTKNEEHKRLVASADGLKRTLGTTRLKIKTVLLGEDYEEEMLAPLVDHAKVLKGQIVDIEKHVVRLVSEIEKLRLPLESYSRHEGEHKALKARMEELMAQRSVFLAQLDQLVTSIDYD